MVLPQKVCELLLMLLCIILLYKYSEAAVTMATVATLQPNVEEDSTIATPTTISTTRQAMPGITRDKQNAYNSKREAFKRAFSGGDDRSGGGGECDLPLSWLCLKIEFVKLLERLSEKDELNIVPGVSVIKDRSANATTIKTAQLMADVARSYPNDPDARLNGYIVSKLSNFLQTRVLSFKLANANTIAADARHLADETGRKGKFGKKGGLEAIIAAGLMMKGTLMAIGMGAIALMAGKALMTALMALTLSGVLGLKSLAGGGGKSTTYEIVAKPIYTSSHSHSISHDEGHGGGGGGGGHGHGHYGSAHSGSGYGGYARSLQLEMPNHLTTPLNVQ